MASELILQLDGNVYVIEKKDGVETSKAVIDSNVVLQLLVKCLEVGLPAFIAEIEAQAKPKVKKASKKKAK